MADWLLPVPPDRFVRRLVALERRVRDAILGGRAASVEEESGVAREAAASSGYTGDTLYRIDERGEAALLEYCADWARDLPRPMVLVAEGLPGDGRRVLPETADPADADFECIVDPIDGTRGLMYDKRSAWALAAVAPGAGRLGRRPTLADVVVAVQSEIPTSRARLADVVWAVAGHQAQGQTEDLGTGAVRPMRCAPSRATTLAHGFATIAKFFPGVKEAAAWLEERLFAEVVGESAGGAPLVFDDEYISSGGQLYELMVGHDRFVADLRPVLMAAAHRRAAGGAGAVGSGPPGLPGGTTALYRGAAGSAGAAGVGPAALRRLCARPYDLCTELIARAAGVVVTDAWGRRLAAPLDTDTDVAWIGYANDHLRRRIEPVLQRLLRDLGAPDPPWARSLKSED